MTDPLQDLRFYRRAACAAMRTQKEAGWNHLARREFAARIAAYHVHLGNAMGRRVKLPGCGGQS